MSFVIDLLSWSVWIAGVIGVTVAAANVAQFVRVHFLRAPTSFAKYGAGDQHFALVTGASDGIGKQYAIQLVRDARARSGRADADVTPLVSFFFFFFFFPPPFLSS